MPLSRICRRLRPWNGISRSLVVSRTLNKHNPPAVDLHPALRLVGRLRDVGRGPEPAFAAAATASPGRPKAAPAPAAIIEGEGEGKGEVEEKER